MQENPELQKAKLTLNISGETHHIDMKRVNTCPACHQKIPEDKVIVNATFDP